MHTHVTLIVKAESAHESEHLVGVWMDQWLGTRIKAYVIGGGATDRLLPESKKAGVEFEPGLYNNRYSIEELSKCFDVVVEHQPNALDRHPGALLQLVRLRTLARMANKYHELVVLLKQVFGAGLYQEFHPNIGLYDITNDVSSLDHAVVDGIEDYYAVAVDITRNS